MKIRQCAAEDVPSIVALQGRCPQTARWLAADYARLAEDAAGLILGAGLEVATPPRMLGFAAFRRIGDEAEMMNLAVDPEHQHRGVARALLGEARQRLVRAGVKSVFLEVRPSNKPALGLYYSAGFSLHALRKGYYQDPREDAYVLCWNLSPPFSESKTQERRR